MNIKHNDTVKIITGKDKGKTGKVLKVMPSTSTKEARVVVEGLNLRYKHVRPKNEREKGQRIMFPYPLKASNTMLVCPKCNKAGRVAHKKAAIEGKTKHAKQRICRHCGVVLN